MMKITFAANKIGTHPSNLNKYQWFTYGTDNKDIYIRIEDMVYKVTQYGLEADRDIRHAHTTAELYKVRYLMISEITEL